MDKKVALRQLKEIEKLAKMIRLAADGWDTDWKTLVATLMSARTTDKKTIPTAEILFSKYDTLEKLSNAKEEEVASIIRPVNFYRGKAKRIKELAGILIKEHGGKVPHDFDKLVELPGVGRKTANVFLAEYGYGRIGVDTHVGWVSKVMGWTKHTEQHKVERDLMNLFPEEYWGKINWILVRFGQSYPQRKDKMIILKKIKEMKNQR